MRLRELKRDLAFAVSILRKKPFDLLLQVTNRCNMRCSFCDFWPHGVPAEQELSVADYARLEQELWGFGRFLVSLEGGEPLLRPDILDIVELFSKRHISVLYTNGWHIDRNKAESLFGRGLVQVGVSVDFPDAGRHDAMRGLDGAFERAWRAVELLRDAAPHGGKQVHVLSVYMEENQQDLEGLLKMSAERDVGHSITLLSTTGFRRAPGGRLPRPGVSKELLRLWKRYPNFRVFREYLARIDDFLDRRRLPTCRAGVQSLNIDHVGQVSACIEKIDQPVGNIREEQLAEIHARLQDRDDVSACRDCWTLCRGFSQLMSDGGTLGSWRDLGSRMRSN